MAEFGERLKEALATKGMKQTELSKLTGIDKGTISHYISGSYKAKADNLYEISKALDVSEAWLMGLDVPKERKELTVNDDELPLDDREVLNILSSFSKEKRRQAISYLRYLRDSKEQD